VIGKVGFQRLSLLQVKELKTYYTTLRGAVKAVDGVNFEVKKAEAMGLAGESGCGKSTIALSILRILPSGGRIVEGKIFYKGKDLVSMDEEEVRQEIRWKEISIVFQGAMNALNPVMKVSDQIVEAITLHEKGTTVNEARDRVVKLFELVGMDPSRMDNYPHEFSGGMRQRAMIAMALACNPSLLIADEPSTALDVIVAAQVLKLMKELKERLHLAMILITHDLSIIAEICDSVVIMYAGEIAESGSVVDVFKQPVHPYTQGLIAAFPDIKASRTRMSSISGSPPDLLAPPPGCRFHPRCKYAMDICRKKRPETFVVDKNHTVACWLMGKR
jgi:peptide/nickel transport system ATP-binding protein